MGEVIGLLRVMPAGVLNDTEMQKIIEEVKSLVKNPARLGKVEVKDIAFGLRSVEVTVSVPDEEGGLDPIVQDLSKIKNVDSVEVIDIGRI
jgi:translation elongation factor aEF-1 beta